MIYMQDPNWQVMALSSPYLAENYLVLAAYQRRCEDLAQ